MILHRLQVRDFRGVVREQVEVPSRGVLVIEGPNESGKTSLMDALEMLLEHKATSSRGDIKAAKPVGRDVPVVVEAEFTVGTERMCYRKEFVRGRTTSLTFPGSTRAALSGDDAHDHVRDLLDREVDRSLWKALRIAQDEPIGQVDAAKGMDSLRRALDAAAGGADPTGDDSLLDRVAAERYRYLTAKRDEPTGDLARSQARLDEARTTLDRARARHAELDTAVADHEARSAVHQGHVRALAQVAEQLARLEESGRAVTGLRESSAGAEAEVDRAAAAHDAAVREQRQRHALVERAERDLAREQDLRAEAEEAAARLEPADGRATRARAALEQAEEVLAQARTRLDAARAAGEAGRARSDLTALERRLDTLRQVGDELAAARDELSGVEIDAETVDRIRAADEQLREARVRSAASAPRVALSGEGTVRVAEQTVDAGDGWSGEVVEETVFEVGTVALTVSPAGDTDTVRRDEAAARSRLEALLAEAAVDSAAAAETRLATAGNLRHEIDALRKRRADLLGVDTPDDLASRHEALLTVTAETPPADETTGGQNPEAPDPASEVVDADEALGRARADDRTAAAEAETLRTGHATRVALADEAGVRAAESAAELAAAREKVDDADLAREEERTRARVETARAKATQVRDELDAAVAASPPDLLDNARASHAALVRDERESAAAVATALGRVNAIGDQGLLQDVSAADSELDAAEKENEALWRRARAADLLHRTLLARRSEALRSYQAPFHRAVVELGSLVYGPEFDVELGEDLTIVSRRLGDVTVPYESLSGGAREQLAVIVRIACARLVGDEGVPVFLDDTMGYTDPSRRLTMGAVIAAAASSSQVIVLTCDRARFAGIGGAHTHVMRSSTGTDAPGRLE